MSSDGIRPRWMMPGVNSLWGEMLLLEDGRCRRLFTSLYINKESDVGCAKTYAQPSAAGTAPTPSDRTCLCGFLCIGWMMVKK